MADVEVDGGGVHHVGDLTALASPCERWCGQGGCVGLLLGCGCGHDGRDKPCVQLLGSGVDTKQTQKQHLLVLGVQLVALMPIQSRYKYLLHYNFTLSSSS